MKPGGVRTGGRGGRKAESQKQRAESGERDDGTPGFAYAPNVARSPIMITHAIAALSGSVSTHAIRMLIATPQRTALMRLLAPAPMIAELMLWVVDTGMPRWLAERMTAVPLVWAAKPCNGEMRMIFEPMVLMMRLPPAMVPRAIALAHAITTQYGTSEMVFPFASTCCGGSSHEAFSAIQCGMVL